MGCCTSSAAGAPEKSDSPVLITRQAAAEQPAAEPIDASRAKTDEWWAEQRSVRTSEQQAEQQEAEPILAPPTPAPPDTASTRRSRASSVPQNAKHMTTAQLKAKIRGLGVELEDGLSRGDLEDLLRATEGAGASLPAHV